MKPIKPILLALLCLYSLNVLSKSYVITDFGAVADTGRLSTNAIQEAIDACNSNGGGQVVVPAGHYKTGTIILKSNVTLNLETGAVLYGSKNLEDYIKLKPSYVSLRTQTATIQLIYAENATNVGITGYGEINGQGCDFKKLTENDEGITRPHLIRFITCSDIHIENINLKNSGCWMQHYLACEKIRIHNVRVFNRNNFNNDALDLDGCSDVTVSNFISDSDDDGITLKSTSPKPCENITITNCVISSRCNAIKMGTESNGGFKNICISNCVVKPSTDDTSRFYGRDGGISGISLEIVDGGIMEGIAINNIQINGTESPLFIRLANRARPWREGVDIDHVGTLGDISISNVQIVNAGKTACSITGQPGFPVHDIRLKNITIGNRGGGIAADINRKIGEKPKEYPEATMFGTLPAHGFFIRHAQNVTINGLTVKTKNTDVRPVLFLSDVFRAKFSNIHIQSNEGTKSNIRLEKSKNILVVNSILYGESKAFVELAGDNNSGVFLMNNILPGAERLTDRKPETGIFTEKGNVGNF